VELVGAARASVNEYVIEFASARGSQLRVHCKSTTPPDWAALLHRSLKGLNGARETKEWETRR